MSERKRFEAWATKKKMDISCFDGFYGDKETMSAWKVWQAACPDGWQCVPKETTEEMDTAAYVEAGSPSDWYGFKEMWQGALSAAPKPGDV